MSRVRAAGMTVLLLGTVAACGTSTAEKGPAPSAATSVSTAPHESSPGSARPTATRTSASESVGVRPPYIDHVVWVSLSSGRSLQVYPTENGRVAEAADAGAEAWREVLRKAPTAGTPGMRAQFECHWAFARLAQPDKTSWNLEPWRPVVSAQRMYDTRCNPGGPEV